MTIPPLSLGIIKGAEWLKALNAEMFTYGQAHGHMNKNAEHTSVHALAGRLQAGPSGNLELTVPSSLIKGVFDALDEPGAEFVVRNNRTESAIKVMTKEEVDKLGGTSHITERGHSYHYTLGPIVELPATGDYDKLWAISIKSNDLEDIRKSYGLETSPQLGFYIPVGCKKKRVTEDNAVSKLAGVYTASGDKVQGVGLRKMYHSLLEEQGLPGLGVNNEDTGDVELSFDGDEAKRQEVFNQLGSRVQAKTGHPVTFAPVDIPQSSVPVSLSNKDTERLNAIHHLAYRMSNMYDPADPLLDSNDNFKQKLADRFRLQVNQRGLKGTVPSRAAEQLLGTRPMYEGMMPARRTRSEEEALSDMAEEQKRRLLKALKGGRGFLAPNESGISKLASLLKSAGETFKYSDKVDSSPVPTKAEEDINRRSAEAQAKWAPANAATNLRLQNNEKQRFAALTPEAQNSERQTKRDAYDDKIYQQLSQGHGLEGASSDFANILPAAQAAKWVGKGLYSGANSLATAAIKSPITPSYIKNTFNPEYPLVRDALKGTSRTFGANTPNVSVRGATNTSLQAAAENPNSSYQQMRVYRKSDYIPGTPGDRTARGTMFASKELPKGAGGVYSGYLDHAAVKPVKGTIKAKRYMRHELGHGLQENIPWAETLNGPSFNSLHTTANNNFLGRSFLSEVGANAAESRTPLGQVGRALDFATSPMQLATYWRSYTPAERWVHGTLAAPRAAAYGAGGVTGAYHAIDQAANVVGRAGNDLAETIFPSFSKEKTTSWARPIPPPSQNVPVPTSQQLSNHRPGPAYPAPSQNTPAAGRLKASQHLQSLATAPSPVSKLASLLKKAEGEDTPSPIKPAEPLPVNKLPSMQPDPDPAPLKNPRNRRPVDMPLYTFPSGSKQVGHIKHPDAIFTKNPSEDWESGAGYSKGNLESPGASSGPGVLRFSSHGGGEPGRYSLSNPGNHPIYLDDKSYDMPKFMQGQNPSTVISSACNLEGGCDPSVYARAFAGANPENKSNLKNVAMTPPGKLGLGTAPLFKGYAPELGSIGAPYFASLIGKLKGGGPLNDYSLREGGDPTNKDDWKNNGIYTKGRQSMPLFGLPGEAIEAGTHFYRGGNFKQLLDNTEAINTNPDATEMQKFYSTNARLGSSAAVAATRSIPEIISSISENNHLRAMQDRSQRKLSKTPAVQTPGLYPGVPIN